MIAVVLVRVDRVGVAVAAADHRHLPRPTPDQVQLFTVLSNGGLVVVSILGIAMLVRVWWRARQE